MTALDVATSAELEAGKRYEQPDLFSAADGSENGGARSGLQERKSPGAVDERTCRAADIARHQTQIRQELGDQGHGHVRRGDRTAAQ